MDLKKDWVKLVMAVFCVVAAVFAMIWMLGTPSKDAIGDDLNMYYFFSNLALFIFFLGTAAALVLKCFDATKDISKYVTLGLGVVCTVIFAIVLFKTIDMTKDVDYTGLAGDALVTAKHAVRMFLYPVIFYLVAFGLLPLVKGLGKLFVKADKPAA